jgi:hypothetical protein
MDNKLGKRKAKKLVLNREVVHTLKPASLGRVMGGAFTDLTQCGGCNKGTCTEVWSGCTSDTTTQTM